MPHKYVNLAYCTQLHEFTNFCAEYVCNLLQGAYAFTQRGWKQIPGRNKETTLLPSLKAP